MRTSLLNKRLRSLITFAISIMFLGLLNIPSASAIGALYNGTSGDVACGTSGFFTITNKVVVSHSSCVGSVTIPNTVTSVASRAFMWSSAVTSLNIGTGVTEIADTAFYDLGVTSLNIPGNVTTIGADAFKDMNNLTTLTLNNGLTTIGSMAFRYARKLTSLSIPGTVTSIPVVLSRISML